MELERAACRPAGGNSTPRFVHPSAAVTGRSLPASGCGAAHPAPRFVSPVAAAKLRGMAAPGDDPHNLQRFVAAQEETYAAALGELCGERPVPVLLSLLNSRATERLRRPTTRRHAAFSGWTLALIFGPMVWSASRRS